jgi:hypothetical protein
VAYVAAHIQANPTNRASADAHRSIAGLSSLTRSAPHLYVLAVAYCCAGKSVRRPDYSIAFQRTGTAKSGAACIQVVPSPELPPPARQIIFQLRHAPPALDP